MFKREKIRNIAIIAHIDHGKTTMLDSILKQSQSFLSHEKIPERVMDSFELEKERGITIFAKHTSILYQDYKINIIDTPGHADFSGEVERILGMVNSVLLLVDAKEGPMPQTRFVLLKSLQMGLRPIVVLNKIDRPNADPEKCLNHTFDLFVELGASDEQLDFAYCYASGLKGYAIRSLDEPKKDMNPLFDLIIERVSPPEGDIDKPFLMQAATIEYDDYLGRQACGRILRGKAQTGLMINLDHLGERGAFRIQRIEIHQGLKKVEVDEVGVGDIAIISGIGSVTIGDTLFEGEDFPPLKPLKIEEPTLSIDAMVNSGPLAGKDGKYLTMNKIRDRLFKEKRSNVTLRIEEKENDKIAISGRGELHLGVLLETLRREGYELCVSRPRVIIKEIEGQTCEPMKLVHIEVPEEYQGVVIEEMSSRRGEMQSLDTNDQGISKINFLVPTRGMMDCSRELMTITKGLAIMTAIFDHYAPMKGAIPGRKRGVLISLCEGMVVAYACAAIQKRGVLFVKPGDDVYEGMIVGENSRENDLIVNVTKGKHLTNVRASGKDENILLTPPRIITLEDAIAFIADDEYVEITPKNIRLRKAFLKEIDRRRAGRSKNSEFLES